MKRILILTLVVTVGLASTVCAQTKRTSNALSDDEQMKLFAVDSLMQTQPERALPLVEKMIASPQVSPALRRRAVHVVATSKSPQTDEILTRIYGAPSTDEETKREMLRGYMASSRRDVLLKVARTDSSVPLRREAVRLLGALGAEDGLAEIYRTESSAEVREEALRAMGVHGDGSRLLAIAKSEKDEQLRQKAITYLGQHRSAAAEQALTELYDTSKDSGSRKAVIRALVMQRNAKALVAIARKETSPELKREAVSHLGHLRSPEATDFLMELLNK